MNVAVKDMMWFGPWRRRATRKPAPRATLRRKPVAPVVRPWEGAAAALRGALIMALGLVLAGVLGWLWATLTDPHLLPVKRVQVEGSFNHLDAGAVRDAVAPDLTGNLLIMDVRRVQRTVEALPWVRRAEVRRVWPDAVHISVQEQGAKAIWNDDALVNEEGEVFQPPRASYPKDLPLLRGPTGSGKAVVMAYQDMSAMLAPIGVRIARLDLNERRAWSLELNNGMRLVLGRGDGYGRLLKFVRFYRRALQGRAAQVDRVDLRYSNGFAVSWKQSEKQK